MKPVVVFDLDGRLEWYRAFLPDKPARALFERLREEIPWRTQHIRMMGRSLPVPRLTAYFGDQPYSYSGQTHAAAAMPASIAPVLAAIQEVAGTTFNSVLLNHYRDGRDSMGWHADNERELGPEPMIASLSLGATRRFLLKHRQYADRHELALAEGDLVLMHPPMQAYWRHALPKTTKPSRARINITFRHICSPK